MERLFGCNAGIYCDQVYCQILLVGRIVDAVPLQVGEREREVGKFSGKFVLTVTLAAILFWFSLEPPPGQAAGAPTYWTEPGFGDWDETGNWSTSTLPDNFTAVWINNGGTAQISNSDAAALSLTIGQTLATQTSAILHLDKTLTVSTNLTLGQEASGSSGNWQASDGLYYMNDTGGGHPSLTTDTLIVSDKGYGVFIQQGGTVTVTNNASLTFGIGGQLRVGDTGTGVFNQTGGSVNFVSSGATTDYLRVGVNGGTGTYYLQGATSTLTMDGMVQVGWTDSGSGGTGSFYQSGGSLSIVRTTTSGDGGRLLLGYGQGTNGYYELSGGQLTVGGKEILGLSVSGQNGGTGVFVLTGGEILLRQDFQEIYAHAKKCGMLIELFSNGTLIDAGLADFLRDLTPAMVEITVYGRTQATFEAVTRVAGSYERCLEGIDLLLARGVPLTLKTMVMTINAHELWDLKAWAEGLGVGFRYDMMLNARLDGGQQPLALRRGALLHSCGVMCENQGWLFVGMSGAGKSTIAKIWQAAGGKILGDDRIVLRRKSGLLRIFGTPWPGELGIASPDSAPLKNLFFLEKSSRNYIRPLRPLEVVARLVACSFLPLYNKEGMEAILDFFSQATRDISCHELGFIPEPGVIDFLREAV
uniref:Radical SAM protein n=1 Tax=Desulfobacca acetoxidans TaxID=60893 RepID=A0A7V6DPF3_9BACT